MNIKEQLDYQNMINKRIEEQRTPEAKAVQTALTAAKKKAARKASAQGNS